jgi:hypothetical protein
LAAGGTREQLENLAAAAQIDHTPEGITAQPDGDKNGGDEGGARRSSQADKLVALAGKAQLFHTPGGHDSEGYASVPVNGHWETWPINSNGFRRWLARVFYEETGKAPGSQALQDALNVLAGMAIHDGAEHAVSVRVAEHDGAIYLDLADDSWQAVEISAEGWRVVSDPPVKFRRARGMLPLPAPVAGGSLSELRPLVNLPDDQQWVLFGAWLVAALRPGRPFPVLCVNGEQGSAKSTLCRMCRALIDPNVAPLRRPPRDDRDLLIAATNGWVVAFDNLSGVRSDLSDALCTLATGGGFATRQLYTDADEKLFDAVRPIMLNGIEDVATRADLLDRAITLTLPVIPDEERRDEDELWQRFNEARPRILGALLDAVSAALRNRTGVRLASKPRMADFVVWTVAAEPSLPWEPGAFLAAYTENRGAANAAALEASTLSHPLTSFLADRGSWIGTASELLEGLERFADEKTRKRRDWPTSPRKLAGDLRRLAPDLRRGAGWEVKFDRDPDKQRRRLIRIERTGKTASEPSTPSGTAEKPPFGADDVPDGVDGVTDGSPNNRPKKNSGKTAVTDGLDDSDDPFPAFSAVQNGREVFEV